MVYIYIYGYMVTWAYIPCKREKQLCDRRCFQTLIPREKGLIHSCIRRSKCHLMQYVTSPARGCTSMAAIYSVRNGRGRFTVYGLVAISDIYNADRPSAPHSWTVAAAAARGRKGKGERRATCRIKYGLRWGAGDKQM